MYLDRQIGTNYTINSRLRTNLAWLNFLETHGTNESCFIFDSNVWSVKAWSCLQIELLAWPWMCVPSLSTGTLLATFRPSFPNWKPYTGYTENILLVKLTITFLPYGSETNYWLWLKPAFSYLIENFKCE